jgi:hypothetical protein
MLAATTCTNASSLLYRSSEENGCHVARLGPYDLGFFDQDNGRVASAENPFGAKAFPMCPDEMDTMCPGRTFEIMAPRRDYSALRASPLRGRPSGARHRRYAALSSNRLFVCRGFEFK